jgi:hypothetical protein
MINMRNSPARVNPTTSLVVLFHFGEVLSSGVVIKDIIRVIYVNNA